MSDRSDPPRARGGQGQFAPRQQPEGLPHNTPNIDFPGQAADPGSGRKAGATVTVACKLPHGMICELGRWVMRHELVMGGGTREVKVWDRSSIRFVLRGNVAPHGVVPTWPIVGGYGLTHGIPKDDWEAWLAAHLGLPVVRAGLVFAFEEPQKAMDAARERAGLRSGLEPLDPNHPPPGFRRISTATREDR